MNRENKQNILIRITLFLIVSPFKILNFIYKWTIKNTFLNLISILKMSVYLFISLFKFLINFRINKKNISNIKEFLKIENIKKTLLKIKSKWTFKSFTATFTSISAMSLFLFFSNDLVAIESAKEQGILTRMFEVLNPYLLEYGQETDSLLSSDVSIPLMYLEILFNSFAISFVIFFIVYYIFQVLFEAMSSKLGEVQYDIKVVTSVILFVLMLLMFTLSITKNQNGYTRNINIINFMSNAFFYDVVKKVDNLSVSNSDTETLFSSSFKANKPEDIMDDYLKFLNAYLLSYDINSSVLDYNDISISFDDDKYKIDFGMGGLRNKIEYSSNVQLNKELLKDGIGINLFEKEQKFIVSLLKSMAESAINFNKILKATDAKSFEVLENTTSKFQGDYKIYCKEEYENFNGFTKKDLNLYMRVYSYCSAKKFMEKQYETDLYNISDIYDGKGLLSNSTIPVFGDENIYGNYEDFLKLTKSICSNEESYLACAEAGQRIVFLNNEKYSRLGIFYNVFKPAMKLYEAFIDMSDVVLKSKSYTQTMSSDVGYINYTSIENSFFMMSFRPNEYFYENLILDDFELVNFSDFKQPSETELLNVFFPSNPNKLFDRINTCFKNSRQIKNGYLCESKQEELYKLSAETLKMVVTVKLANLIIRDNKTNSSLKKGTQIGEKLDSATVAQKIISKNLKAGLVGLLLPSLTSSLTKQDEFYGAANTRDIIYANYLISVFSEDIAEIFNYLLNTLLVISILIIVLVSSSTVIFTIYLLKIILELFVMIKATPLILSLKIYNNGLDGLNELKRKYIVTVFSIILTSLLIFMMPDFLESFLNIIFVRIFDDYTNMSFSFSGLIQNLISFTVTLLISVFFVMGTWNFMINKIEEFRNVR